MTSSRTEASFAKQRFAKSDPPVPQKRSKRFLDRATADVPANEPS